MASTAIQSNSEKISSFLQDVQYHSLMVNSASFNVRLLRDRKTRLPFLDSQTGIAQSPCKLYINARYRMPGLHDGQLYAYPAHRWFRRKRSYLTMSQQCSKDNETTEHSVVTVENPALNTQSEESSQFYEAKQPEMAFYDSSLLFEEDEEEPDNEDDDSYSVRTSFRKRRKPSNKPKTANKTSRGRRRRTDKSHYRIITDADDDNPGKPYECGLCGARYKTRQGLSYHLSHTHHTNSSSSPGGGTSSGPSKYVPTPPYQVDGSSSSSSSSLFQSYPGYQEHQPVLTRPDALTGLTEFQDSYLGFLASNQEANALVPNKSGLRTVGGEPLVIKDEVVPKSDIMETCEQQIASKSVDSELDTKTVKKALEEHKSVSQQSLSPSVDVSKDKEKRVATPNTYCDFCLGTSEHNAKTGLPEEMISCADCGRSGHLYCLQFSNNMAISVKQYRWQCIECKCCTICGTSENDDKLLFCDDCDRGNHLYCANPPLSEPPEGEWSCELCVEQFHKNPRT